MTSYKMADYSSWRISAYVATILLHVSNCLYMASNMKDLKIDLQLKNFSKLQPRYFTCWNFGLQVIYAAIALFCEILILRNSSNKAYKLNKHLNNLRDILFAGILWPSTLLVFTVFWSLFLLDRELIFPKFVDKALTPFSNHVIHTLIVPIVLWEVVFRPRITPKSHKRNLLHLLFHLTLYFSVMAYTYSEYGIWLYPIFDKLYGTVYFPVALLSIVLLCVKYYYLQWVVTGFIWGTKPPLNKTK